MIKVHTERGHGFAFHPSHLPAAAQADGGRVPRLSATPSATALDGKRCSVRSSRLPPFGSGQAREGDGERANTDDGEWANLTLRFAAVQAAR